MSTFDLTFEATGFTLDANVACAAMDAAAVDGFNDTMSSENGFPAGVQRVLKAYVSEDDNQTSDDRHVFVCVTLRVEANSLIEAESMIPPKGLLTRLADFLGQDASGNNALDLEAHSWELTDSEPAQPASLSFRM